MSKDQKEHYALRVNNTAYYAGYSGITDQLRKAKLYNSLKHARSDGLDGLLRTRIPIERIEIITVSFNVIDEIDITEEVNGYY